MTSFLTRILNMTLFTSDDEVLVFALRVGKDVMGEKRNKRINPRPPVYPFASVEIKYWLRTLSKL